MTKNSHHDYARRVLAGVVRAAITAAIALPLVAFASVAPAQAETNYRATVRTIDLDLTNSADLDRLERRMGKAARRLCREISPSYATPHARGRCVDRVIAANRPKVEKAIALASAR